MSLVDEQQILQGKHVLLAEDNDLNAEIAIMILEAMGLIVERVEDGIQCVAKMEQMPAKSYDLILMDIQMPQMDGYEATQIIRTMELGKAIPIFALSADAYVENKRYSKEMGMDGHFSKPIDFDVMEKELSEYFSRRDA
mgnify:FL=1